MKTNFFQKIWDLRGIILLSIMMACGIIFTFFLHPILGVLISFGFAIVVFIIYAAFKALDARDQDIRERYGDGELVPGFDYLYYCIPRKSLLHEATSHKTLGFDIPEYEIVGSYGSPPNFNGDFTEIIKLRFSRPLSKVILDKLLFLSADSDCWSMKEGIFTLTLDEIDLDKNNDHFFYVNISENDMEIIEGRV